MLSTKIVVIGAGSAIFGLNTLANLMMSTQLRGSELALVDINSDSLSLVGQLAERLNKEWQSGMLITSHNHHSTALEGADFVVVSIEVTPREKLWKMDYEIPLKHGVRQPYAENGGPGGFAHAARNIGPLMDIARDMEKLCPDAWMINFSNPMIRMCDAVNRYSKIKVVGLCHQIYMGYAIAGQLLSEELGIDSKLKFANTAATPSQVPIRSEIARQAFERINIVAAGINHFTWVLSIHDRHTGEDLYPIFRERWDAFDPDFEPLTRRVFEHFGLFPVAGDEHICEYLPWVSDPVTKPWEKYEIMLYEWDLMAKIRNQGSDGIALMGAGKMDIEELKNEDSEGAVELIQALASGGNHYHLALNLPNQGYIENLPNKAIVEVPGIANGLGVHGLGIGMLPQGITELCRRELTTGQLCVDAVMQGDRKLAMQSLLLDPVVRDIDVAQHILDDYLYAYRDFLPQFWT
jgi:alpha-galactosidase